jgi:hypothetical protein
VPVPSANQFCEKLIFAVIKRVRTVIETVNNL